MVLKLSRAVAVSSGRHPRHPFTRSTRTNPKLDGTSNLLSARGCVDEIQFIAQPSMRASADRANVSYVLVTLATDRWRIVNEEVAWTASGVVWISHGCCRWATGLGLGMMWVSAVTDVTLVIGSTTLPAHGAWAASGCYTALVAIAAKMTAS
jgi:hypothetical protein